MNDTQLVFIVDDFFINLLTAFVVFVLTSAAYNLVRLRRRLFSRPRAFLLAFVLLTANALLIVYTPITQLYVCLTMLLFVAMANFG